MKLFKIIKVDLVVIASLTQFSWPRMLVGDVIACTNLRKVQFLYRQRSSFTIGGAQTLVGFAAATGIMESDPTWVEVRSLPLVSGHFDQLFIAISLKTPFLASLHHHQLTGRRWLARPVEALLPPLALHFPAR